MKELTYFVVILIILLELNSGETATTVVTVYENDLVKNVSLDAVIIHMYDCPSPESIFKIELRCTGVQPTEWLFVSRQDYWVANETDRLMQALVNSRQWTTRTGTNNFVYEAIVLLNISCSNIYKNILFGNLTFKCKHVGEVIDYNVLQEVVTITAVASTTRLKIQKKNIKFMKPEPYKYNGSVAFTYDNSRKAVLISSNCHSDKIQFLPCPWSSQKCKTTYPQMKKRSQVRAVATTVSNKLENVAGLAYFQLPSPVPGVYVCTKKGSEFGVEYFFSYKGGIPKLELNWNSIDPRDLIQLSRAPLPSMIFINDSRLHFSCKVTKYGFSHTPYFEGATLNRAQVTREDLIEPENAEEAKVFWVGNFTYVPKFAGKHRIRCVAQVWNTTESAEQFVEIYVQELSRQGRKLLSNTLPQLEQDTANEESEIFQESNSVTQVDQVLVTATNLLDDLLRGNKSIKEIKADVDAGLGVYLNIAKNSKSYVEGPLGPAILNALESTLQKFGNKVLTESDEKGMGVEYDLSNGLVGVNRGQPRDRLDLYYPLNYTENSTYIYVPKEWSEAFGEKPVLYYAVVLPGRAFDNGTISHASLNDVDRKTVNSDVVSFTFKSNEADINTVELKNKPVRIVFKHKRDPEVDCSAGKSITESFDNKTVIRITRFLRGSGTCAYLNTTTSKWSTNGCRLISSNEKQSVCECNHLTAFALLMEPFDQSTGHNFGLKVLTWVVCPPSILGLIATLIVFVTLRPKGQRTAIIINLSACLLFGNLCILLLMEKSYLGLGDVICTGSAMLTHYIYLTAFSWMTAEGIQLYRLAIIVFQSARQYHKIMYVGAYGVPIIIVAITALIAFVNKESAYGGDCFCWLVYEYIWSFFVPAAIMLTGNFVILILSVRVAIVQRNSKNLQVARKVAPFLTLVRGILGLTILLGLSWSVGFMMFSANKTMALIGAYLFTLLNGLQGAFMFIFHVLLNKQIRDGIKEKVDKMTGTSSTFLGYFSRGS